MNSPTSTVPVATFIAFWMLVTVAAVSVYKENATTHSVMHLDIPR